VIGDTTGLFPFFFFFRRSSEKDGAEVVYLTRPISISFFFPPPPSPPLRLRGVERLDRMESEKVQNPRDGDELCFFFPSFSFLPLFPLLAAMDSAASCPRGQDLVDA